MSDREIELKLTARPQDAARLRKLDLPFLVPGKAVTKTLESTYFDTDDLRLHACGLSLRVRRQGRRFVQTLKSAPDGGGIALDRGEWESPVPGGAPSLSALPDAAALAPVQPLEEGALKPVFASHVKRTVRTLAPAEGHAVELAIDIGEIRTPDGQVLPLSEVELELKNGTDPKSLYDAALALNALVPLRVEMRTKSERGYALAAGAGTAPVKAGRVELSPHMTVEEVLERVVRQCLDHLLANEACALAGRDPEGIHQMRVALRRLRSAFAVFRDLLPPDQHDRLAGEVKWLAGAFTAARDWDVFRTDLMAPVALAFPGDTGLEALDTVARRCRDEGYGEARAAILSARYTELLLRLGAWLDGRGWRDQPVSETSALLLAPVTGMAGQLLEKRHRQARKRGRHFRTLDAEARHRLRISLKKLRYAADFFRGLYPAKPVKRYLDDLAALQADLGHLQDVATITKLLGQVEATPDGGAAVAGPWRQGAGMVLGWHARGLKDMEPRLVRDWEAFAGTKPFWSATPSEG